MNVTLILESDGYVVLRGDSRQVKCRVIHKTKANLLEEEDDTESFDYGKILGSGNCDDCKDTKDKAIAEYHRIVVDALNDAFERYIDR